MSWLVAAVAAGGSRGRSVARRRFNHAPYCNRQWLYGRTWRSRTEACGVVAPLLPCRNNDARYYVGTDTDSLTGPDNNLRPGAMICDVLRSPCTLRLMFGDGPFSGIITWVPKKLKANLLVMFTP